MLVRSIGARAASMARHDSILQYLAKNFQPLMADEYSYLWTAIGSRGSGTQDFIAPLRLKHELCLAEDDR